MKFCSFKQMFVILLIAFVLFYLIEKKSNDCLKNQEILIACLIS